jgi:hypothetical protein
VVQAILASLMIDALFLDILSNRKQVWVAIGLAAGLAYLAREARRRGDAEEVGAGARTTTGDLSLPRPTRRKAITATAPGSTA